MKKIILFLSLVTTFSIVQAQLLKKLKEKVDKKVDKTVDDATGGKKDEKNSTEENQTAGTNVNKGPATLKSYSKYDFVPGEKIVVFEDFMQDAIGDLPAKWNTNGACETVTIEGQPGQWMKMTQKGVFMPDFIDSIPPDCTLEFDLMVDKPSGSWGILPVLAELDNRGKPEDWRNSKNYFMLTLLTPGENGVAMSDYNKKKNGDGDHTPGVQINAFSDLTKPVHVAMWRQKERLRIYLNEEKTWDVPKAIDLQAKFNSFILVIEAKGNWNYYMSNLRLAVGAPDTRKKILEQNKWVTHGILFDVNSDKIKPESYGTIKEMATVLKENPDLKVKIVGHTDSDGSDAANLDLSKKRSAAVKDFLVKEFGIDEGRMQTDGKGETEPIDKNDTPAGKANNRRVEFIKI
ncbi:MAG: OmpA family protein [Acidobacteria bacterium]|nr:MAG: OmpA family protein [Acidobacteriota bacterium]